MTGSDTERLVRRFFGEALAARDMAALRELCAPDYVWHGSPDPRDDVVGRDAFEASVAGFYESFPDCDVEILDLVAEGDRAVVRFNERGTHDGPFMGIAPTGRRVHNHGIAIYRARDGRLVEEWSVADRLSLLHQLGAVVSIGGVEL
jgi:NTE family protein